MVVNQIVHRCEESVVMLRRDEAVHSLLLVVRCVVFASLTSFATAASGAAAAGAPPTNGSDPMTLAAAYIGVPTSTLAVDIVEETGRTGVLGLQVAVDQLDSAMAAKLSALPPTTDQGTVMAYLSVVAGHHDIRDALLDRAVTTLRGALGG
ncbi:MAG: hypothetical protein ABW195_07825 [Ilumatobacteraceae bacterium]